MIKILKFILRGYFVLLDTDTDRMAYITKPWEKKPLEWIEPTTLAYGCKSCACKPCREGFYKDSSPCGYLLGNEISPLPPGTKRSFHYVKNQKAIDSLNRRVSQLDLNAVDVYLDDYPHVPTYYNSWKEALRELCAKKGYKIYHHHLDGASYQIHAGGISVNGYLNIKPFQDVASLKDDMASYLYLALANDPDFSDRMDYYYNCRWLELKMDDE